MTTTRHQVAIPSVAAYSDLGMPRNMPKLTHERRVEFRKQQRIYTLRETSDQEEFLLNGFISGESIHVLRRAFKKQFPDTGTNRFRQLSARVRARMVDEDKDRVATRKVEQINRTMRVITKLRISFFATPERAVADLRRLSAAIREQEQLLADLTGTREPLKVEVDMRVKEAVTAVVLNMSPEQMNARLQDFQETMRLAGLARDRLLVEHAAE
jgi:hypothetical protein